MPRPNKPRLSPDQPRADPRVLAEYRQDRLLALRQLLFVDDRDNKGSLIPFEPNQAQRRLWDLIEKGRAFAIARNLVTEPAEVQHELVAASGLDISRGKVGPAVAQLVKEGVDRFLHRMEGLGLKDRLHDGPLKIVIPKARRQGMSSFIEALFFLETVLVPRARAVVMAHKGENVEVVYKYARDFWKNWNPKRLEYRPQTDYSGLRGHIFQNDSPLPGWGGSQMRVMTAGGEDSAVGDQFDLHHFSESSKYEDYAEVNQALVAAPKYHWVFEESTGNGPQGGFYGRVQGALRVDDAIRAFDERDTDTLDKWNGYFICFLSWLEDPGFRAPATEWERTHIEANLDDHERALRKAFPDITTEQIKWRRQKIASECQGNKKGLPPEQFFEENFPATLEEAFQSTGNKWFDPRPLRRMLLRAKGLTPEGCWELSADHDPKPVRRGRENLIVWKRPRPGHAYTIGLDVAQGLRKGDWSVAVVLDRTDGTVCEEAAFFRSKLTEEAVGELTTFLAEWYNTAYIVPEAMGGCGVAACLRIVHNRYPFIYHRRTEDLISNKAESQESFRFGFQTTNNLKALIVSYTKSALQGGELILRSEVNIGEHVIFETDDAGRSSIPRYTAPPGEHDDAVIATALAFFGHRTHPMPSARLLAEAAKKHEPAGEDKASAVIWKAVMQKIALQQAARSRKQRRNDKQRAGVTEAARSMKIRL